MAFGTLYGSGVDFTQVFVPPTPGDRNYGDQPAFALGTIMFGSSGTAFVYVLYGAGGATAANYGLFIDEAYTAVMAANAVGALGDRFGVAQNAAAQGNYGWAQIFGPTSLRVSASAAANVQLATTTTAGELDDAVGTGTKNIVGVVLTTANGGAAGSAPALLNWPVYGSTNA